VGSKRKKKPEPAGEPFKTTEERANEKYVPTIRQKKGTQVLMKGSGGGGVQKRRNTSNCGTKGGPARRRKKTGAISESQRAIRKRYENQMNNRRLRNIRHLKKSARGMEKSSGQKEFEQTRKKKAKPCVQRRVVKRQPRPKKGAKRKKSQGQKAGNNASRKLKGQRA